MSEEISISLPILSRKQRLVLQGARRFNLIAGGRESGKTTLAVDVACDAPLGAIHGHRVAFFVPDDDALVTVKRRLFHTLEPLICSRPQRNRIELFGGGAIQLFSLEDGVVDLWEQVSLIVVDDAPKVENFFELWEDVLRLYLARGRGQAWIFGKPRGANNGFGRLFRERMGDESWQVAQLPSDANPKADVKAIQQAKSDMDEVEFLQEYRGEVVDQPIELSASQTIIGRDETFLQWCDRLAADGLKVDGIPFRLDDRPTMRWVYSLIPSTIDEAFGKQLVLMKCAQVGFTVMEMLAMIYLALKFMPCKIGMYLPDMKLAGIKSSERFMPIVRTVPPAYRLMMDDVTGARRGGEGNILVRNMGGSRFHFMWTSGKAMTESVPLDVVSFDEVQEMTIADMEKTKERMSASRIRYTLMGSTANWPDRDIHFFYKKGSQHQFWTRCPSCGEHGILDDHFPECIRFVDGDYRYVCHACGGVIDDPQAGEWRAANADAGFTSVHYPQFLSSTISPREIIEAYFNADDMKNFFNRKRGKPYLDPSQVPVDLEMLNDCAKVGVGMGVVWKERASGAFMGIDQMGAFNVVLIAERLPSGHMAIIHAEEIYDNDPFARCDVLMAQYGVAVCCVETLPNYNDAKRFAGRHPGKVFLAGYADIKDDMLRWGDAVPNAMDRKTSEEDRDRYTVTLDQYKCMQVAMKRIQNRVCVFPDPMGLVQEVHEKGLRKNVPLLKERVFLHFTRTALVADLDDEERKYRRRVVKVGLDPHFSYAYMLLNVAWARSHGTTMFLNPADATVSVSSVSAQIQRDMPGLPSSVVGLMELSGEVCGRCVCFEDGRCSDRGYLVQASDPGCLIFIERDAGG